MDSLTKIENSIASARARVEKAKQVRALYDNPIFNQIVVKDYFEAESVRCVHLYGSGSGSPEMLVDLEKDMHAIGAFRRYLSIIMQDGLQAEGDLHQNQEALQEELAMRAESQRLGEQVALENDADYAGSLGA